jgi:hypothetical protein
MDKKGQIAQLQSLIIPLIGIGVVLAIGFLIMAEVKEQSGFSAEAAQGCNRTSLDGCSGAVNGTNATIGALADIPGWLPIIIITVIGVILIGLVSIFRGQQ